MKKLLNEYRYFTSNPWNMRVLIVTNLIYALAMPIIELFIGAYVMRNSQDVKMLVTYQLAVFTGIPFTFLANGFLLQRFSIKTLYSVGMLLSGFSMIGMMTLGELTFTKIIIVGLAMGVAIGLYWSNRDFLALSSTSDENRNYYFGLENFISSNINIIVPFFAGLLIASAASYGWFGGNTAHAYHTLTAIVFILSILASFAVFKGQFVNPPNEPFIFFDFHPLWKKILFLALFKGLLQGYMATAPAMLIMQLVGGEGTLGSCVSISGVVSACLLYWIGRNTTPEHRIKILSLGLICFVIGSSVNAVLFNAMGVLVFMVFSVISRPLQDMPMFAIQMQGIDTVSEIEKRNSYSYIFNQEFGLYLGRLFGLGVFLLLAFKISNTFALRFALLIIGVIALYTIIVAKRVVEECRTIKRM